MQAGMEEGHVLKKGKAVFMERDSQVERRVQCGLNFGKNGFRQFLHYKNDIFTEQNSENTWW